MVHLPTVNRYLFFITLVVGIAARCAMLFNYELVNGGEVDVYLADEGVVGLMAKHILEGREWPVFFYGQDYLGALEAYCVALAFRLVGVTQFGLRLVPFLFSVGILAAVYRFAYRTYSVAAARWATALVALAPAYFLQWTLKARGGFVEHILLVFLMLLWLFRVYFDHDRKPSTAVLFGFICGVAVWVNQLALGYLFIMVALLALDRSDRRGLPAMLAGFAVGASLLLTYNVVRPLATVRALARKAVVLNRVPEEERDDRWVARGIAKRVEALKDGADKLGLVFGVPPGASVERLGMTSAERHGATFTRVRRYVWMLPLLFFGMALFAAQRPYALLSWERLGPGHVLSVFFVITIAIGYVSPRYMLPAYPLAAVLAGALISRLREKRQVLMTAGCALVIGYNLVGWADAVALAAAARPRDGTDLVASLRTRGWTHCYSAGPLYHLIFASAEEVILTPLQKNRYPPYDRAVEASPAICYVYREDQADKRQHLEMMELLGRQGVTYGVATVGPYRVLHDITPRDTLSREVIGEIRRQEALAVVPLGLN